MFMEGATCCTEGTADAGMFRPESGEGAGERVPLLPRLEARDVIDRLGYVCANTGPVIGLVQRGGLGDMLRLAARDVGVTTVPATAKILYTSGALEGTVSVSCMCPVLA